MKEALYIAANEFGLPEASADGSTLQTVLGTAFLFAGGLAFIFIIVGGLKYVLSAGDPNQTATAKNTILYAAIGLIVSLAAFTIVQFVIGRLI